MAMDEQVNPLPTPRSALTNLNDVARPKLLKDLVFVSLGLMVPPELRKKVKAVISVDQPPILRSVGNGMSIKRV
jgi:hypothetical protein